MSSLNLDTLVLILDDELSVKDSRPCLIVGNRLECPRLCPRLLLILTDEFSVKVPVYCWVIF